MKCWWTMPMPSLIARRAESTRTTSPSSLISPSSGWCSPYRMFIRVDLPAPFSPSRAWISPRRSSKSMASLATSAPNRLVIPRSSSASASPDIGGITPFPPLLHRVGDVLDLAGDDLLLDVVDLGRVLLTVGVDLA